MGYVIEKCSHSWLVARDFKWSRAYSDNEINVYIKRFPVYKSGVNINLFCRMQVYLETCEVKIDVVDCQDSYYAPWYLQEVEEQHREDILSEIRRNIAIEFRKLKIKGAEKNDKENITTESN